MSVSADYGTECGPEESLANPGQDVGLGTEQYYGSEQEKLSAPGKDRQAACEQETTISSETTLSCQGLFVGKKYPRKETSAM